VLDGEFDILCSVVVILNITAVFAISITSSSVRLETFRRSTGTSLCIVSPVSFVWDVLDHLWTISLWIAACSLVNDEPVRPHDPGDEGFAESHVDSMTIFDGRR